jgi:hypothetical protein
MQDMISLIYKVRRIGQRLFLGRGVGGCGEGNGFNFLAEIVHKPLKESQLGQ